MANILCFENMDDITMECLSYELELESVANRAFALYDHLNNLQDIAYEEVELRCMKEGATFDDMTVYLEEENAKSGEKKAGVLASIGNAIRTFVNNIIKMFKGEAGQQMTSALEQADQSTKVEGVDLEQVKFYDNAVNTVKGYLGMDPAKIGPNDQSKLEKLLQAIKDNKGKVIASAGAALATVGGIVLASKKMRKGAEEIADGVDRIVNSYKDGKGRKISKTKATSGNNSAHIKDNSHEYQLSDSFASSPGLKALLACAKELAMDIGGTAWNLIKTGANAVKGAGGKAVSAVKDAGGKVKSKVGKKAAQTSEGDNEEGEVTTASYADENEYEGDYTSENYDNEDYGDGGYETESTANDILDLFAEL